MSELQKFILSAYHDTEGNSDAPSYCRVVLGKEDAQKILGRMNLVREIAKVDGSIEHISYTDGGNVARFYYSTNDDGNDVPDPEDYVDAGNIMMEVHRAIVSWSGFHNASNDGLSTEVIRQYQLKRIVNGIDPFIPPTDEELTDGL